MDIKLEQFFIETLKELKGDIRQLDGKLDTMHEVLIKNTVVLEEHEKRSTNSEIRIESLENKYLELNKKADRIKGFVAGSGILLSTIATLAAIFHYLILPLLNKG